MVVFLPFIILILIGLFVIVFGLAAWIRFGRIANQKQAEKGSGYVLITLMLTIVSMIAIYFFIRSFRLSDAWRDFDHNLWVGFWALLTPVFAFSLVGVILYYSYRKKHETPEEREKRKKRERRSRGLPW